MPPGDALLELKRRFHRRIAFTYEHAARDCRTCPAPQACCTDVHFVNVHVTRLEAVAIERKLAELPDEVRRGVRARALAVIQTHQLSDEGDTYSRSYGCPLYVAGTGCLVHHGGAKPAPCIQHACYEREEDVPPSSLERAVEAEVEALNREAYGDDWRWRPMPLWLVEEGLDAPEPSC